MNKSRFVAAAAFTLLFLGACERRETLAETNKDVTSAQIEGQENVAEKQGEVAKVSQQAGRDITDANLEVAVAQATSDYRVAVEKCETQTGSVRAACKSAAQAVLDAAQVRVDAVRPDNAR
jgi:hypothetical protein